MIRRLSRNENFHYRDIGLMLRTLEPYQNLIQSVFTRFGIPFFIDKRRGVGHHPMVELIRSVLRVAVEDWSLEHVIHYLKTDLAPLNRDQADRIENTAITYGVRGRRRWMDKWPGDKNEETDAIRLIAIQPLADFQSRVAKDATDAETVELSGNVLITALVNILEKMDISKKLSEWSEEARQKGQLDLAEEHTQVWSGVTGLLSQMLDTLAEEKTPPA